jgi:hypothetical protein
MNKFLRFVDHSVIPVSGAMPAHNKGRQVYSDFHEGLVVSDGSIWVNTTQDVFPFPVVSGDFMDQSPYGCAPGTVTLTANLCRLAPFIPRVDFTCDQVDIDVTTLVAGGLLKIAVYDSDGTNGWLPGTLLSGSADQSSAATGLKTSAVSPVINFKAGRLYWVGVHSNSATHAVRGLPSNGVQNYNLGALGGAGVTTYLNCVAATVTYASGLPSPGTSTFVASTRTNATTIRVRMRVQ